MRGSHDAADTYSVPLLPPSPFQSFLANLFSYLLPSSVLLIPLHLSITTCYSFTSFLFILPYLTFLLNPLFALLFSLHPSLTRYISLRLLSPPASHSFPSFLSYFHSSFPVDFIFLSHHLSPMDYLHLPLHLLVCPHSFFYSFLSSFPSFLCFFILSTPLLSNLSLSLSVPSIRPSPDASPGLCIASEYVSTTTTAAAVFKTQTFIAV